MRLSVCLCAIFLALLALLVVFAVDDEGLEEGEAPLVLLLILHHYLKEAGMLPFLGTLGHGFAEALLGSPHTQVCPQGLWLERECMCLMSNAH